MKKLLCFIAFMMSIAPAYAETVPNTGILTFHIYTSVDDDTVYSVKDAIIANMQQKGLEQTKMDMVFLVYKTNELKAGTILSDVKSAVLEAMNGYDGGQILISWILAAYGNIYTGYTTFE